MPDTTAAISSALVLRPEVGIANPLLEHPPTEALGLLRSPGFRRSCRERPALFDAPASTERDIRNVPDSFLTASPDAVLSRVSQPCLGFRWGYATKAGSAAELLPLSALDVGDWRDALPLLEREFPDWTFAKEWAG